MVDPANTILHVKDIFFIILLIFVALAYRGIDKTMFLSLLFIYVLISLSIVRGLICNYSFNLEFMVYVYKTFVPLLLLLWMKKTTFFTWRSMVIPGIIISLMTFFVVVVLLFYPEFELFVYSFFDKNGLMVMGRRPILGVTITTAYYRSLPLLFFPTAILLYRALNEPRMKFWNMFGAFIFSLALFLGGTRACSLSVVVLVAIIVAMKLYACRNGRFMLVILTIVFIPCFLFVVYKLMSETTESSNVAKYAHIMSYGDLINNDPLLLFFGAGAGSEYYSKGFNSYTFQTEWSYFEFIRMFGIPGALVLICFYSYPLLIVYRRRGDLEYPIPYIISYVLYLIIAGTNPLLIGSDGILALIYSYNYAYSGRSSSKNEKS